ncbi:MAG: hypothetical protein CMI52_01430 [Parcubacteria group bacterium]|nr:hypothetical protein [Parcubacteria group bacterium]
MDRILSTGLFLLVALIVAPLMIVGIVLVMCWGFWSMIDHPGDCEGCESCLGSEAFRVSVLDFSESRAVVEHPTSMAA